MNRIIERDIAFEEKENAVSETLFHNANGYIGVRNCMEEGTPKKWDSMRGTYINGFYDVIPMKQAEALCGLVEEKETMLNIADLQTIRLQIDGVPFDMEKGTILQHKKLLDMDAGITTRITRLRHPDGKETELLVKRLASFEQLNLFLMEYSVRPCNYSGRIEITSCHIGDVRNYTNPGDPRLAAESMQNLLVVSATKEREQSFLTCKTANSGLSVCTAVAHELSKEAETELVKSGEGSYEYILSLFLEEGETFTLDKYCIFADSIRNGDVQKRAKEDLEKAVSLGKEFYYKAQRKYLQDFWNQSEVSIQGDDAVDLAMSFNLYQLLQSSGKDGRCNVAAKGLSGEGYEGHYFWDTEMFILPFFILTNPGVAKALLSYRFDILPRARENAKILGHKKGALYPWRTINGKECSGYFPSGTAQYHINGDIAYALISYYLTTGDLDFIREKGFEILLETSRVWMDLGNYCEKGFVLNDVTGPDEYTCIVNNNYYTNCSAKYALHWTVKFYDMLKGEGGVELLTEKLSIEEAEIQDMQKASETMFLPYDEGLGINPQDDSFLEKPVWDLEGTPKEHFPLLLHYHPLHLYRYQVCKQADTILAYFLFEKEQSAEVMKRSYEYYEKITTHDSSLSTCVFSIVASRLGMKEKGIAYLGDSTKLDLCNTHENTKDGIHTANMGGCYMAVVNGFAGVRVGSEGLSLAPFLPEKWEGYSFRIGYRGSLLVIRVSREGIELMLVQGEPVAVTVYDQIITVAKEKKQCIALQ